MAKYANKPKRLTKPTKNNGQNLANLKSKTANSGHIDRTASFSSVAKTLTSSLRSMLSFGSKTSIEDGLPMYTIQAGISDSSIEAVVRQPAATPLPQDLVFLLFCYRYVKLSLLIREILKGPSSRDIFLELDKNAKPQKHVSGFRLFKLYRLPYADDWEQHRQICHSIAAT